MGKMTVYHGSYTAVQKPEIRVGRNTKDFGQGFYCTVIKEQAERWAKRYDTPCVNIYTVRMDTSLKILEFKEMTEEWLDFIISCRYGKAHDYDIVIGAMANDQIYNFIADYMDGIITRDSVLEYGEIQVSNPSDQFLHQGSIELSGISCL